ncbi:ArsR family transcriptional regulator [Bacillus oleivorans]|uniref:ArsR family transcriptional regulator n=1 Tax=Bacillus oleivorans TaxID=1448271 RepID=A0A285CSF1_9BACI|nr:metalloregulator ArsR/SmtB family transcription factor [Bacillus oleivorans]SNX69968.1 ArsR family transcriptional regulator [Bacillus oleivorans]
MESERTVSIDQAAIILKLLGDSTRLTMVKTLSEDECCVCEFVELLQMSQPAISQHIRKLKDAGLIKERRKGQWIFYSLNHDHELMDIILPILTHLPSQKEKLVELEKSGKRISCC